MPELSEITSYIWTLENLIHRRITRAVLKSPFLLRSITPGLSDIENRKITGVSRIGKQVVVVIEDDIYLVIHLMVNGRFKWLQDHAVPKTKTELLAFQFDNGGTLMLAETGAKRRMSLHIIKGARNLDVFDPGGVEVPFCEFEDVQMALKKENHTLKRALTDPKLFSGIGNKYSDEILFCAGLHAC